MMRTYKYIAILEKDGQRILWRGRAVNKAAFLEQASLLAVLADGWTITDARKSAPETRRPRRYNSFACVDLGQAARF